MAAPFLRKYKSLEALISLVLQKTRDQLWQPGQAWGKFLHPIQTPWAPAKRWPNESFASTFLPVPHFLNLERPSETQIKIAMAFFFLNCLISTFLKYYNQTPDTTVEGLDYIDSHMGEFVLLRKVKLLRIKYFAAF